VFKGLSTVLIKTDNCEHCVQQNARAICFHGNCRRMTQETNQQAFPCLDLSYIYIYMYVCVYIYIYIYIYI
jgi:hypothetical protein